MDVTHGEFESFPSSARSRRSDTRSSMRSETSGSLEILPPEELNEQLFMSEELSDDDSEELEEGSRMTNQSMTTLVKVKEEERSEDTGTPSSQQNSEENESPELQKMIKKMKKYEKILEQKLKKEKEVKLQRLLFQKQMLKELASVENKNEEKLSSNATKFLALMPPPEKLQELMYELQKEEFVPIFQTQLPPETDSNIEGHNESGVHAKDGAKSSDSSSKKPEKADKAERSSAKPNIKKKIDFIKRNIELAKDAGNYVSMTDDEKARLSELLADLDVEDGDELTTELSYTSQLDLLGQGYSPDEEEMRRLAEIDEKIQSLVPEDEFNMICGTPHLSARNLSSDTPTVEEKFISEEKPYSNSTLEDVQKRLESIDQEWRNTFEGTTPRLTNEQLQRLLGECCSSRSSVCSFRSLKASESQNAEDEFRPLSQSTLSTGRHSIVSALPDDESVDDESVLSTTRDSVAKKLPRETLDQLLAEARSSLGLLSYEESVTFDSEKQQTHDSPLFHYIDPQMKDGTQSNSSPPKEVRLEDV